MSFIFLPKKIHILSKTSKVTKNEKQNHYYKVISSVSGSLNLPSFIHALRQSVVLKQSPEATGKLSTVFGKNQTEIITG